MVYKITDRVLPMVSEWQNRSLESLYSFIFLDVIHYKARDEKQIVNNAAYVAIGVNMDGEKDIVGLWIGGNETSKFWLSVLNDFKTKGIRNVLVFCTDGLNGFSETIALLIHPLKSKGVLSIKYV